MASAFDSMGRTPRRSGSSSPGAMKAWCWSSRLPPSSEGELMPTLNLISRRSRASIGCLVLAAAAMGLSSGVVSTQSRRFYDDDPITRAPESQDASKAQPYSIEQLYEQVYALFVTAGKPLSNTRAGNINTI